MELKPCPFCGLPAKMHTTYYPSEYADSDDNIPAEPCDNLSKPCNEDVDIPICTKASLASRGIYKKAEEGET